jgi:hypothetical protein
VSISGIASSTSVYPKGAHPWFPQLRKDLAALETSMASGDLAAAQKAFATLTKDRQNVGQAKNGPQTAASSQLSTDLAAVGNALQSGKLAEARKAFETLIQDMQKTKQTQGLGKGNSTNSQSVGTNIDVAT